MGEESVVNILSGESVLNLWVVTPLGIEQLFFVGSPKTSENTDIYKTSPNSSNITYEAATKMIL